MKKLTLFLGVVLVLMLIAAGVYYFGGTLHGQARVQTAMAGDYPAVFTSVCEILSNGSAPQRYDRTIPESAEGYALADITVDLRNYGLFPAEWLHIECEGQPGDIAVYSLTGEGADVPARSAGSVNLKLITAAAPDIPREITLEYYVYGMKRTIRVTAQPEA